jgi:hypothetical protein
MDVPEPNELEVINARIDAICKELLEIDADFIAFRHTKYYGATGYERDLACAKINQLHSRFPALHDERRALRKRAAFLKVLAPIPPRTTHGGGKLHGGGSENATN